MPLARIITSSADDSLELSMQLRARGFRVETVAPDQIPETPADLEVRVEECAPEDVLVRAAEVDESEDLWVFVAPGALDERTGPVRSIPVEDTAAPIRIARPARDPGKWSATVPAAHSEDPAVPTFKRMPEPILPAMLANAETHAPAAEAKDNGVEGNSSRAAAVPEKRDGGSSRISAGKVKVVVLPKAPEAPQVPEVPEKVVAIIALPEAGSAVASKRSSGPYKIAFRTGPVFWKQAAVSILLVLLAGVIAAVMGLRPSLPAASKPVTPVPAATRAVSVPARPEGTAVSAAAPKRDEKRESVSASAPVAGVAAPAKAAPASSAAANASVPGTKVSAKEQPAVKAKHPPGWVSDRDIIARDTVVFYDRKTGKPTSKAKGNPAIKQRESED